MPRSLLRGAPPQFDFAAFGSEMITDGSKGLVKPTAFHMTSGQQKFLKMICSVADSLRSDAKRRLKKRYLAHGVMRA
jgi:hypothetical protein